MKRYGREFPLVPPHHDRTRVKGGLDRMAPRWAPQDIPLALNLLALLMVIAFLVLGVVVGERREYREAVKSAIMRRARDTGF